MVINRQEIFPMWKMSYTLNRFLSIIGFSLLSAYLLSFLFEGQVFYNILAHNNVPDTSYIMAAIIAHFGGLFSCGFLVKSTSAARYTMFGSMGVCLMVTLPFYFSPSPLWMVGLIAGGCASGCAIASWGYFLKAFTPGNQRLKTCADVLICSNVIMIAINVVAVNYSSFVGLTLSLLALAVGMVCIWMLPTGATGKGSTIEFAEASASVDSRRRKTTERQPGSVPTIAGEPHSAPHRDPAQNPAPNPSPRLVPNPVPRPVRNPLQSTTITKPLALLCLFIFVITINSGLMYKVINPAFGHLVGLVSWYWAAPYVVAIAIVRNLPAGVNRPKILYVGMAMIMGGFISFMLLGRGTLDYLVVDTLMLGACGVFDLFWWSIIGEMLDYTKNPAKIFGIGLSANVFGVLMGGVLGIAVTSVKLSSSEIAVIALTVVCVTLIILPPLNRQLVMLLKNHVYLSTYSRMSETRQADIVRKTKVLEGLTAREQEVLQHVLHGESNRKIAEALFVSESTVKTHIRNIFSKYDVGSRAELISTILKNQSSL